jgi:predicted permease
LPLAILLRVLTQNIFPAFVVIGVGFALDRAFRPHVQSISRVALYALSPALVFHSLVSSQLEGELIGRIAGFTLVVSAAMLFIGLATSRAAGWEQPKASAFTLSAMLTNSGNFGFSVILFAYGEAGLQIAVIFFVTSAIWANTVGAFIAARSQGAWRHSAAGVLRLPVLYASLLALLLRFLGYTPPQELMRPIGTMGQAAVPVMLLVLGMQLSRSQLRNERGAVLLAAFCRLVVSALVALALAGPFGLEGLARRVCIVEAATPAAVTGAILAAEFGARPDLVASTISISTLACALTLTVLIAYLG